MVIKVPAESGIVTQRSSAAIGYLLRRYSADAPPPTSISPENELLRIHTSWFTQANHKTESYNTILKNCFLVLLPFI